MSTSWERMVWRWGVGVEMVLWVTASRSLGSCHQLGADSAIRIYKGSIRDPLLFRTIWCFNQIVVFLLFFTLNFAFSICICFCGLSVSYCTSKLVKFNPSAETKWFWKQSWNLAFLFSFVSTKFLWLYADNHNHLIWSPLQLSQLPKIRCGVLLVGKFSVLFCFPSICLVRAGFWYLLFSSSWWLPPCRGTRSHY